jgi:phosphoribosylaminoimidazolecarboxamide formyltransferase / IMP cyclohydrolase
MIKRALISVSDKTGIVVFAKALQHCGVSILSTGGTAKILQAQGVVVTEVADYTGFPEIMQGRVKTLHPKIHAGLLRRPGQDDALLADMDIEPIDLLVVNLYPFAEVIKQPDGDFAKAIENIDIGGPCMLRAAAKNHQAVTVVVDQADYAAVIAQIQEQGQVDDVLRYRLAQKTFAHTAAYDAAVSNYLNARMVTGETMMFPERYTQQWIKSYDLRYGENPHQAAACYQEPMVEVGTIVNAVQCQGKPLSYNNIMDADAALSCVKQFDKPACVIVKHANPCGVAQADNVSDAYQMAFNTDTTSAFGGIIAVNQTLKADLAKTIIAQQFVEVIIAPEVDANALRVLSEKPNVRVLACGQWTNAVTLCLNSRYVANGLLLQEADNHRLKWDDCRVVTKKQPDAKMMADLLFAWKVAQFVKSNAIVYARGGSTVAIGAGQMSRVDSARIAALKAQDSNISLDNAVMASDAFFPFRDAVDTAANAGICAIIQPGGSMRDKEVIAAADEAGIAMVFTGIRHFRH